MAGEVCEELEKIVGMEGMMTFRFDRENFRGAITNKLELLSSSVFGYQQYASSLNELRMLRAPKWARTWLTCWNLGLVLRYIAALVNSKRRQKAMTSMVIRKASDALIEDVTNAVMKKLEQLNLDKLQSYANKRGMTIEDSIIRVYFIYADKGLVIQICHIQPVITSKTSIQFTFGKFGGYTTDDKSGISRLRSEYERVMSRVKGEISLSRFQRMVSILWRSCPEGKIGDEFFEKLFAVDSPKVDEYHRWFAVTNIIESKSLMPVYEAGMDNRAFFYRHMGMLKSVLNLAEHLKSKAKELGTSLCDAQVAEDDEHIVSCKELFPVALLTRKHERPVHIKGLPEINGQLVGLTGPHKRGKTVASLSLAIDLYKFHMGIPPFGHGIFRTNPKKVLGVIFMARGDDSTMNLMLTKAMALLTEIIQSGCKGKDIVFLLDELGSATQHKHGGRLELDVLECFSKNRISTLISTQITDVAETIEASPRINGQCFRVNDDFSITPGIGDGELGKLRGERGFDKLLAQANAMAEQNSDN